MGLLGKMPRHKMGSAQFRPLEAMEGRLLCATFTVTSAADNNTSGLLVTAGASTVRGLVINRFGGNGVMLMNKGGDTVAANFIGTDATGTAAASNGGQGVFVQCSNNLIGGSGWAGRNVIS